MKWSFATVGLLVLGLIGISIILLFQSVTTNNENDYYLLKEVTEASMIDAIDIPYYRETGDLKIVKEKFVENFTRRYAESTLFITNKYTIKYYDIIETPPKVSVIIDTGLGQISVGGNAEEYNIKNKLDAILEYVGKGTYNTNNPYTNKTKDIMYYAIFDKTYSNKNFETTLSLKKPSELIAPNIKDLTIAKVEYIDIVSNPVELNKAMLQNNLLYNNNNITNYMQNITDFANNIDGNSINIEHYNCGISKGNYICDDQNFYWTSIKGLTNDINKDKIILKYKVSWEYKEYELAG